MRNSQKCPKCNGRTFYEVSSCTVPAHDCINATHPLTVAAAYLPTGKRNRIGIETSDRFLAQLQAWVCAGCGFTEFYVGKVEVFEYMLQHRAATVRKVDATVGGAKPFR